MRAGTRRWRPLWMVNKCMRAAQPLCRSDVAPPLGMERLVQIYRFGVQSRKRPSSRVSLSLPLLLASPTRLAPPAPCPFRHRLDCLPRYVLRARLSSDPAFGFSKPAIPQGR